MPGLNASSEDIVLVASAEDMAKALPSHDARKMIIATDVLASVDGFCIMVHLTFQHLWGMISFVRIVLIVILQQSHVGICVVAMLHQKVASWVE